MKKKFKKKLHQTSSGSLNDLHCLPFSMSTCLPLKVQRPKKFRWNSIDKKEKRKKGFFFRRKLNHEFLFHLKEQYKVCDPRTREI